MTNKQLIVKIAAVLSTLHDVGGTAIASMIYLAFGSDISDYDYVIGFGKHAGWLTATSTHVSLTEKGRTKAAEITALMEKANT